MEWVLPLFAGSFVVAIVVGMTVRAARAPRGRRARAAFGPLMSAGDAYQELHTGQKGLHDSVIESIADAQLRPARTDGEPGGAGDPTADR